MQALCHSAYADASTSFASIASYQGWRNDGRWWEDTQRGYIYSLIAARDDAKARNVLTALEAEEKWKASKGDRLFWDGSPQAAFAAYAASSDSMEQDGPKDPNIMQAAQTHGDWNAAITLLSKPSGAWGPSSVKSEQLLMLGDAYATQRNWREAYTAWVRAADAGHAVPEWDFFDPYNISALEMIYYYRAHIPADQRSGG